MIALLDFIEEHRSAVAADLIDKGLRLRDFPSDRLTYGDMLVIVLHAPRTSAIARSVSQDKVEWDLHAQIMAEATNALRILVWQQTRDGERNRNRPKPILPPWAEDEDRDVQKFGRDPVPLDELDDFLGWTAEMTGAAPLARPPQPRDPRGRFMRRP